jgi:hypothetical protein
MSYRLNRYEPMPAGFTRTAAEQTDGALDRLQSPCGPKVEFIG